jgi:small subunit ribosomal protein S8
MSMTDPIADFLTRIRNATRARKERVDIPWSRLKDALAGLLVSEGYLSDATSVGEGVHRQLRVVLKYDEQRRSVIRGLVRVSRPSLRVYVGKATIPSIRGGLGVNVLSTPAGVLSDREAKRRGIGGEILCSVW